MPAVVSRIASSRSGAFAREHQVVLRPELRDQGARAGGAHFLVAVDQHGEQAVVPEVQRVQHADRVKDQRNAVLVVGDAEAVGAIAVDPERLLGEHAAQVDRVHVREQQDPLRAGAPEPCHHGLPGPGRRVLEPDHVRRRLDELHLAAKRPEAAGDELGNRSKTLDVAAARLDRDEVAERVEVGLLFLADARKDGIRGLGEGPGRDQRGEQERSHPDPANHHAILLKTGGAVATASADWRIESQGKITSRKSQIAVRDVTASAA